MQIPGLNYLKDKWVLIGLAAGAGIYLLTKGGHSLAYAGTAAAPPHSTPIARPRPRPGTSSSRAYFPHYDSPGLYQGPGVPGDWAHMRFSGQGELQRRLTIT